MNPIQHTYLFTWNPKKFEWPSLQHDIAFLRKGKKISEEWTCSSQTSETR